MLKRHHARAWLTICAAAASLSLIGVSGADAASPHVRPHTVTAHDKGGEESDEIAEGAAQFAEERTSPYGVINPGANTAAWLALNALHNTGGSWKHVTGLVYNSDDPRYRDIDSNSSGGSGDVTGRTAALAADSFGHVYVGSADGGVWRSSTGGGHWQSISGALPTQATGALAVDQVQRLWLGTGEATTNADAHQGTGVYVLSNPWSGQFGMRDRVGGSELDGTTIHELRFADGLVWAATDRGLWTHSEWNLSGAWHLEYAPNPSYLPGGAQATDPNAPYKNIVNDIAFDPKDPRKVVLATGWRSGDTYNGFFTRTLGTSGGWTRITSGTGALPTDPNSVGFVTFAASADGSRYYAIDQSPALLNSGAPSELQGIYESKSGSPFGPWTQIADSTMLGNSGSALGTSVGEQGWYNQFLQVDPADPSHVYAGLEEVFETKNEGANWNTVGPYWNFNFPCWSIDPTKQTGTCSQTTHSDQHAVAVGSYHGKTFVYVGNDGGVYKRPINGTVDASGHATDWTSLNDGTIDALQYYSVAVGKDPQYRGVAITGGLQDNGQSELRPHDTVMGSNFGGDGGDTIADPANGCNIAQEYVYLAINVTNNCAVNNGAWVNNQALATSYSVAPADNATSNARFIAPITADIKNGNLWVAGGEHVYVQTKGYAIRSSNDWTAAYDLGAGHVATALAASGGKIYAAWCGPCNNQGFTRGIAVGNADGTGWHQITLPATGSVPNRYLSGFAVDPKNANHVFLAVNGYSRNWTVGAEAGVGHVYESKDGGATWHDISANLPDDPADSLVVTPNGGLVVATDLGVAYRAPGRSSWEEVGHLPAVVVNQIKIGPDGRLYAATHGRGIWSFELDDLH